MAAEEGIKPSFVDEVLVLPTREQQTEFLRDAGLLNAGGLDRLLDVADRLLSSDPGRAEQLVELCSGTVDEIAARSILPRANYIKVQTHFIDGDLDAALSMAEFSYDGYVSLGMNLDALRTKVGKMAVLIERGDYQEALDTGRVVLDALDGKGNLTVSSSPRESDLLVAFVHQNLGGCLEYMGQYDAALRAYAVAEERYQALGMSKKIGEVLDNRGAVLAALGRGREALAAHEAAAAIFESSKLTLSYAMSLGNIGETHVKLANYLEGLRALQRARGLLDSLDASADKYLLLRDTADAYLSLNLYSEALVAYREADSLLRDAGMLHDRARALWGLGSALIAVSKFEEAGDRLAEAARLFVAAGNVPMLSGVMLEQAYLLAVCDGREEAIATASEALNLVSEGDWPVQQVYARLRLADLLLPNVSEAELHLLAARRLSDPLALPQLRYRLNERLGHLRLLQGREQEARTLLEAAIDEIERLRGAVTLDAMRASFLRDKIAAYEDLLLIHLVRDDEESAQYAFAVAERAKSRALVDLLTGVAEKGTTEAADSGLEKQTQALQADLNAVYGELLGDWGDEERPLPVTDLRTRALELEQEIGQLRLQSAAVDYDPNPFAVSMPSDDVRHQLPPDTVLLSYHTAGEEVLAFVSVRGRIKVARYLGTVEEIERLLHKLDLQWERFRAGPKFTGRHMSVLELSARQVLAALYERLVEPLEPLLEEAAASALGDASSVPKVAVVPHGPLHRVPFHALFDGERYMIERFEVSYAPSATVYVLCQDREPPNRDGAVVFGVEDRLIPAATAEAHLVAGRLPGARVRVGEAANVEALRDEAPATGILHMACHGLFRSDNPMFSSLKLNDGWLTAADAMSLDLDGALVTLSACESGRSEVIGGDEVLGLTRAFLGAGAATLVVSLWLVQDETTAQLMDNWYGRLRDGEGRAANLRSAQLELKERHPHPYYWAPFVLIGKR